MSYDRSGSRHSRPAQPPAQFQQLSPGLGRLTTSTAIYELTWTGAFRVWRMLRTPLAPRRIESGFELLCAFDLDLYPALDPALMRIWTATEWLYFLEDVLPLDPLPN